MNNVIIEASHSSPLLVLFMVSEHREDTSSDTDEESNETKRSADRDVETSGKPDA